MKINSLRIFSILIIAIVLLSLVDSRKVKKNKKSKKMNRLASEMASMITKGFDWEKDPFLKHLKDEKKYMVSANSKDKWTLIKMVIGKTIQLLGVKDDDVLQGLKQFDDKKKLAAFTTIMKFQKSMDLNDLKPIATDYTVTGLTEKNFTPDKRTKLLDFLNHYVRQP